MDLGLDGQRVVVMGGGSGLGRPCALAFAHEGAYVTLFGGRHETLSKVADEISATGGDRPAVVAGSINELADLANLMDTAAPVGARSGVAGIDGIFFNAGGPSARAIRRTH